MLPVTLRRVIMVALFVEVGLLLVTIPWSPVWERNPLLPWWPSLEPVALHPAVRGAVSGLGLLNLVAGLFELRDLVLPRP